MKYPAASRSSAVDTFISAEKGPVQIPNPYQLLEDSESPDSRSFIAAQNAQFQNFIEDPDLDESRRFLRDTIAELHGLPSLLGVPQDCGEYYYYRVAGHGSTFPATFRIPKATLPGEIKPGETAFHRSEEFHDETDDGGALISSGFGKDGKYWAYSSSIQGSAWRKIHIKDVSTMQRLPDEIVDTKFSGKSIPISWLGNEDFFYQFWSDTLKKQTLQLRFHRIGDTQEVDVVYEDKENPTYTFAGETSQDGTFLFLSILKAGRNNKLLAAKIPRMVHSSKSEPIWHQSFDVEISGDFDSEWKYVSSVSNQETRC
jgi:prolyl oligopeptidase